MIKTLCVFGTRPEAIKMAPLALALASDARFDAKICVTAQHRKMLDQVLDLFSLKPDFDLDVMKDAQGLAGLTSSILLGMESVFKSFIPDVVLVHGDTTTTLAASLSAYYQKVPVAHIEAGLRTGNIYSPWPEEANRRVAGALASLHFSPTETAKENLLREGVDPLAIWVSGNTVIDSLYHALNKIDFDDNLKKTLEAEFSFLEEGRKCILVTGHRRESLNGGLERICQALLKVSTAFPEVDIV